MPAAEAGSQRSCADSRGRSMLVQTHQGPAQTFKIPPQQSPVCWQELQESTTTLTAALVARWNNDTILLHFHHPCAHTNICSLIPVGNAAHTIASLPYRARLPLQEGQSNYLYKASPSPDSLHPAPAFSDTLLVSPRQKSHLLEPADKA